MSKQFEHGHGGENLLHYYNLTKNYLAIEIKILFSVILQTQEIFTDKFKNMKDKYIKNYTLLTEAMIN